MKRYNDIEEFLDDIELILLHNEVNEEWLWRQVEIALQKLNEEKSLKDNEDRNK